MTSPRPTPQRDAMRIVVHAGFHKTGTTSLQQALLAHAPRIDRLFRIELRATSPAFRQVCEAARSLSLDPAALPGLQAALAGWSDGLTLLPGQGLLVSSEDLSGHMPGRGSVTDYRAALPVAVALQRTLALRFGPGADVRFLFTTRHADDWLRSIHWQLAKAPDLRINVVKFRHRHAGAADFGRILTPLSALVPLTIRPLADLIGRLGPVDALYDLADLPQALRDSLPALAPANQSPPHDLAGTFIKLNRSGLPTEEIQRLKHEMRAAARFAPLD